ncbi:MAG: serine hydrolase domain-containing protein, partial [Acidobacteriota bacterium]
MHRILRKRRAHLIACLLAVALLLAVLPLFAHPGIVQSTAAGSQAPTAPTALPNTPAGRTLRAFLDAFNTGEIEALRRFHREHGGDEAYAEKDLGFFKESGGLKVHRITRSSDYEIEILAQSMRGDAWFKFSIAVEKAPPHGIAGIRVEPGDAPSPGSAGGASKPSDSSSLSAREPKLTQSETVAQLESYLKKRVADDQFSGVVLIAHNGKPIFQQAYGLASKEHNAPNRVDTKFNLGSINKIFTRIAILQLQEQGRLTLADSIGKILPDYPNKQAATKVTIAHLLEMESGISDFFGSEFDATPKNRIRTINDYLPLFATKPLAFEPGSRRAYSNGGYIVLGAIIEKISGQSYYDYVRAHVFAPAGMDSTDSYEFDVIVHNRASGYTLKSNGSNGSNGARVNDVYTKPARGSSAGGGYSTAEDLLKFTLALEGKKLLGAEGTRRILEGGLGIAGGAPGPNAALEISPASGYTVIVLS